MGSLPLRNYDIGEVVSTAHCEKGIVNNNWIITSSKGKFVLRQIPGGRRYSDILFEQELLAKLNRARLSFEIPRPLSSTMSTPVIRFKRKYYWMYQCIGGESRKPLTADDCTKIACAMAELHRKTARMKLAHDKRWTTPFQSRWLIKEILKLLRNSGDSNADRYFHNHAEEVIAALRELHPGAYMQLPRIPIHADIFSENILFKDGRLTGVIDFDNCHIGTRIRDLTTFIDWECRDSRAMRLDLDKVRLFVKAYREHAMLSTEEISYIPDISISANIVRFWYMYWVMRHCPERKLTTARMKEAISCMRWVKKNRDEIIERLSS
ncbi:MAG TPA: hypothetical protein ENN69_03990 [Spirochaetia bacterium]|nr:hypothetical protein [Spirochaetia bacterium]